MPSYEDGRPRFVQPYNGSTVNYGFSSKNDDGDQATLGQQQISAAGGPVVFGANRPKPARLRRTKADGSTVSGFVDWKKYSPLVDAGTWKKQRGCVYPASAYSSTRAVRVVAEVSPGLSVCWDMHRNQYAKITQATLTQLGIEVLNDTNNRNAVTGPNSFDGFNLSGAKARIGPDLVSVKYVGHSQADSLPDGWSSTQRRAVGDPSLPAFVT